MRVLTAAADVASVRAGLRELAVASEGKRHRTWALIGPLDHADPEELMDLGRHLVRLDVSALVVVGASGSVHAGAVLEGSWGEESRHVQTAEAALTLLRADLLDDDVVLVVALPEVLAELQAAG